MKAAKPSNAEKIAAYKELRDAADALHVALGLAAVYDAAREAGELSDADALSCHAALGPVWTAAGGATRAVQKQLERRANRLRDDLVTSNRGLVLRIAKRTMGPRSLNDANLEEAVQEGLMGLARAIDDFESSRGSFSTYAGYWIRYYVQCATSKQGYFERSRPLRMPPPIVRAVAKFRMLHGREPEPAEVGCTVEQWESWRDAGHVVAIDDLGADTDDGSPADGNDVLADPTETPELQFSNMQMQAKLEDLFETLSPRNRDIARALFIDGRQAIDVAEEYGLTPPRVAQIKASLDKSLRALLA